MKRIKNFKLFESRNLSNSDKEYIKEVLLELSDDGIGIELDDLGFSPLYFYASLNIDKDRPGLMIYIGFEYGPSAFQGFRDIMMNQTEVRDFSVYKESFDHLKSFLDNEGLEIKFIDLFYWDEDDNKHIRLSNTKGDSGSQWSYLKIYNRFISSISGQSNQFTGIRIIIN
jgi:hypothetical protein